MVHNVGVLRKEMRRGRWGNQIRLIVCHQHGLNRTNRAKRKRFLRLRDYLRLCGFRLKEDNVYSACAPLPTTISSPSSRIRRYRPRGAPGRRRVVRGAVGAGELHCQYRHDACATRTTAAGCRRAGVNCRDGSRYAIPFVLGPNYDAIMKSASTCAGPGNPPGYQPPTYGAFQRAAADFELRSPARRW
jgi:hypothetical protein